MKIGILGGSFDPIHKGHMYMALMAKKYMNLDLVYIIPAGHSPNKDENKMTKSSDRLEMCRLACKKQEGIIVSDIEIKSRETSYTYKTIKKVHELEPCHELYFIMGADSLDYFEKWKKPEIIAKYSDIVVVNRDLYSKKDLEEKIARINKIFPAKIHVLDCPKMDISSTKIRDYIRHKDMGNASEMLDGTVLSYIKENRIYV